MSASLLRLASLAPFAGFMLVAAADRAFEESELVAYRDAINACRDPLIGRMLAATPVSPGRAMKLLGRDPGLVPRVLAAAGVLMGREPDGKDGRAAFDAIVRAVATRGGEVVRPPEQAALALIASYLDAGEPATAGADPFVDLGDDALEPFIEKVGGLALIAGFVVVAAADGEVDPVEVEAFVAALATVEHPLLRAMIGGGGVAITDRIAILVADPEQIRSILRLTGMLFARHPQGEAARAEFMALMRVVAAADGVITADEQRTLDRVAMLLDGKAWSRVLRVQVAMLGAGVLAVLVAVWQLASAGLGLTWLFVPVACALQLAVLVPVLVLTAIAGARYVEQVVLGTLLGLLAAVPIALTSIVVTALFPAALAAAGGTMLSQAIAGFVGTSATGLVLSVLLAVVLRSRRTAA